MDNTSKRLEKLLKSNINSNNSDKILNNNNNKNLVISEHRGYNYLSISDSAKERITYNKI
ncbi:hypothetical protein [Parvimonas micra]|uniref:hypothetical protein n=1 Tax=Parvimonas micra TaxID=33033 RepID=UPI0028EA5423|nr:hypothetical protein [Parvimonas micra]